MKQLPSGIWIHLVMEVKDRKKVFTPGSAILIEDFIRKYSGGLKSPAHAVSVISEHVHILLNMSLDLSLEEFIAGLQSALEDFIVNQKIAERGFKWDEGYSAFSVFVLEVNHMSAFINNQAEYHKKVTYEEEFKLMRSSEYFPLEQADTGNQSPS